MATAARRSHPTKKKASRRKATPLVPPRSKDATVLVYSRPSGYWYAQAHDPTTGVQIADASGYSREDVLRALRGKFAMIGVKIKSITDEDPYAARHHATKKKSAAQLEREINEVLITKPRAEGYRVAYVLVTRRDGAVVPVRALIDAPRPLTLAEAEAWRKKWGRTHPAWVETLDGTHVPVKGAMRPVKFVDDARQGEVHATLTR